MSRSPTAVPPLLVMEDSPSSLQTKRCPRHSWLWRGHLRLIRLGLLPHIGHGCDARGFGVRIRMCSANLLSRSPFSVLFIHVLLRGVMIHFSCLSANFRPRVDSSSLVAMDLSVRWCRGTILFRHLECAANQSRRQVVRTPEKQLCTSGQTRSTVRTNRGRDAPLGGSTRGSRRPQTASLCDDPRAIVWGRQLIQAPAAIGPEPDHREASRRDCDPDGLSQR